MKNKILRIIVFIPNLPFTLIISIYVIFKFFKESSFTEITLAVEKGDELINLEDGQKYVDSIYPRPLRYCIAAIFYFQLYLHFQ